MNDRGARMRRGDPKAPGLGLTMMAPGSDAGPWVRKIAETIPRWTFGMEQGIENIQRPIFLTE